jgi:HK97 family phage prohead protease
VNTEYRTVPFELVELKASDGGHEFTGYASTFGNVDQGGDVVMRGAFEATLGKRARRPLLWQHDLREPIGVEKSLKPDDRGLLGTWKLVDTARGADAYKLLKAGAIDSMSIGYTAEDVAFDDANVRLLKSIDLLECSVVSLPMNEQATVTSVKATLNASAINDLPDSAFAVILPGGKKDEWGRTTPRSLRKLAHHGGDLDVPFEDLLAQVKGYLILGADEAEALRARRAADERKLSDAHLEAIEKFLLEAKAQQGRLERLLVDQRQVEADAAVGNWKTRIALARQLTARRVHTLESR